MHKERLIPLLLLWLAIAQSVPKENFRTTSQCINHPSKVLHFECGRGYLTRIISLFYGYNADGSCHYDGKTGGQFRLEDKEHTGYACEGRTACDLNLPSGSQGRFITSAKAHSNYMIVEYQCIPALQVVDICKTSRLTGQMGYVASPRFPNNYPSGLNCNLTLITMKGQRIQIELIDVHLESAGKNCSDLLQLVDVGHRSATYCDARSSGNTFRSLGNKVLLTLQSSGQGRHKGFWLKYTVKQHNTVSVTSTTSWKSSTTTSISRPSPPLTTSGATQANPIRKTVARTPIVEAAVGSLLGLILCVLLIILFYLVLQRRLPKSHTNQTIVTTSNTCDSLITYIHPQDDVNRNANVDPKLNRKLSSY